MLFAIMLALAGGLFAILTFIHFVVDWIFQTHAEAMVKHNNAKVRARHCAIYTLGFVPLLLAFTWFSVLTPLELVACVLILFVSHFVEDTYLPVFYWALHVRRPPEVRWTIKLEDGASKLYGPDGALVDHAPSLDTWPDQWRKDLATSVKDAETCKAANKQMALRGFMEFVNTGLGKILMIAVDQIIHLAFLFPIVWLVLSHLHPHLRH
jgi:hypothetical protein